MPVRFLPHNSCVMTFQWNCRMAQIQFHSVTLVLRLFREAGVGSLVGLCCGGDGGGPGELGSVNVLTLPSPPPPPTARSPSWE